MPPVSALVPVICNVPALTPKVPVNALLPAKINVPVPAFDKPVVGVVALVPFVMELEIVSDVPAVAALVVIWREALALVPSEIAPFRIRFRVPPYTRSKFQNSAFPFVMVAAVVLSIPAPAAPIVNAPVPSAVGLLMANKPALTNVPPV